MRRVNPDTLEIENIENKHYVFVLVDTGSWDYEYTNDVKVFNTFDDALTAFTEQIETAKKDMSEWCDESDLECDEVKVNRANDNQTASFSIYERGAYSRLHNDINIYKKEVM